MHTKKYLYYVIKQFTVPYACARKVRFFRGLALKFAFWRSFNFKKMDLACLENSSNTKQKVSKLFYYTIMAPYAFTRIVNFSGGWP